MARLVPVEDAPAEKKKGAKLVPVEEPKTSSIARQLGLTARYGIEGVADTVGMFSDPIAAVMNYGGANASSASQVGSYIADTIGLPKPENDVERIVAVPSKLLAGTGGFIKGANVAAKALPSAASKVVASIGSQPGMQAASSIGAGTFGGYAKEQGAGPGGQVLASVAGGVLAPLTVKGAGNVLSSVDDYVRSLIPNSTVELRADQAIKQAGVDLSKLPQAVQQSIRDDVSKALNVKGDLSPDALRRLADYRLVGATPRTGNLTLNPATITQEKNLAKMAANSSDPAAQRLAQIERDNDLALLSRLNALGADTADDSFMAAQKVIGSLDSKAGAAKKTIDSLYSGARGTDGRGAELDPYTFSQQANNLLDDALLGGKLPGDVRNLLNQAATGKLPLNVNTAEQFKTRIGDLQRATTDMAERKALGLVRKALDETPLISNQQLGQESIDAFNAARSANRQWMDVVERTPALKAVVDGVEPDKFVQNYIIGNGDNSNTMALAQLKRLIRKDKTAIDAVRGQIALHLKEKATSGGADEVANFSAANFNRALKQIGDRKLGLFFDKNEIAEMKAIARVASYEKFQPSGSAVNNSNTASTMFMSMLNRIAGSTLARKIPLGAELIANPANNVAVSIGARNAQNPVSGLVIPRQPEKLPPPLWPALGLLAAE